MNIASQIQSSEKHVLISMKEKMRFSRLTAKVECFIRETSNSQKEWISSKKIQPIVCEVDEYLEAMEEIKKVLGTLLKFADIN